MAEVAAAIKTNGTTLVNGDGKTFSSSSSAFPVYAAGALPVEGRLFINGQFRDAKSKKTWENLDPYTGKVLSVVHTAEKEDIDDAVAAAAAALPKWKKVDAQNRAKMLLRLCDLITKHKQQLAELEAMDSGKPLKGALSCDLKLAEDTLRYFAGEADRLHGKSFNHQSVETEGGNSKYFSYSRREPVGVCGQVIPWNFPLLMAVWKLAPVIATGCTTVIKSSERTPLSLLSFAALLNEAGVPPGVINCISGGPETGELLVRHPGVNKVCLTGSIAAGTRVASAAAETGLKRCTLELGGNSPLIIFDDVDIDHAVQTAHDAVNFNMGEVCIAPGRVFVHEKIVNDFLVRLVRKAESEEVSGNPLDLATTSGPLIDKRHYEHVSKMVEKAKEEGAKILTGGGPVEQGKLIFKPTVVSGLTDEMEIAKQEVFGPVVCVLTFKDEAEVIKRANDTLYGLAAGVMTKDVGRAHRVVHALEAGSTYINCWGATDAGTPFGGYKNSGLGRELGPEGVDGYLESKTIVVSLEQ